MIFAANGAYPAHEELGKVNWLRDYDQALSKAKNEGKSVLILFQEVPGCATCRNYGNDVLSHPLIVEVIENEFIPLAIFNNKGGKDAEILKRYNEPSWNNPVVRIVDAEGKNIVERLSREYSGKGIVQSMISSMEKNAQNIPEYLSLLEDEFSSTQKEKVYQMYCFWSGEKQLGQLDAVSSTTSGFNNGAEVVRVLYNPNEISDEELDSYAHKNKMKEVKKEDSRGFKVASNDLHYYFARSDYRFIPLTEVQKTKINSALGNQDNPSKYLSPQQLKWYNSIKQSKSQNMDLSNKNFKEAWASLSDSASP